MRTTEFDPSIEPAEFAEMLGVQLFDATDPSVQWWKYQIADAYTQIDDALSRVEAKYWICPVDHISRRVPYKLPDRVVSAERLIDSIFELGHEKKFARLALRKGHESRILGAGRFRSTLTLDPVGGEIVEDASGLQQRATQIILPRDYTSDSNSVPGRDAAIPSESQSSSHISTESNTDIPLDAAATIAPDIDLYALYVWRTDAPIISENVGEQPVAEQSAAQSTISDDQLSRFISMSEAARFLAGRTIQNPSAYIRQRVEAKAIRAPVGKKGAHLWRFYVLDFPLAKRGELLGGPRQSEHEV
jgi:hypothetical protein